MGICFNPDISKFMDSIRSKIYVDKSELIVFLNTVINTEQKHVCISRPRRFGKSMAVNMLAAYYGCEENTDSFFQLLKVHTDRSYQEHLNKYHILQINMQDFLSETNDVDKMITVLKSDICFELMEAYPDIDYRDRQNLCKVMQKVYSYTKRRFVILIDEWDCLFRVFQNDTEAQKKYLDFLRLWLKDQPYVALAYMTGILPIKKYGTHSALNMFYEYSMSDPGELAPYFGFMEEEVREVCARFGRSFEETKDWYDGYTESIADDRQTISIYNPKSVVEATLRRRFGTYWNQTETYEALLIYLRLNFDGLKDAIISMLAGERIPVNTSKFQNDMTEFSNRDDVLTLLIHLGYLTYNTQTACVSIPNKEVRMEWMNAVTSMDDFKGVAEAIMASQSLLQSLWEMEEEAVAAGIDKAHQEMSILQYNDENALSYTISLAFYAARECYTIVREFPSGKGFADVCFLPKSRYAEKPAILIELKWDRSARAAIRQIKEKEYAGVLDGYRNNLLLAGIDYEKGTKRHECKIKRLG